MTQTLEKLAALVLGKGLILPPSVVTEKLAILAQSGAGKSYTGMRLAELMLGTGAQIVVLDPMGIWWSLAVGADGKSTGFPIYIFGGAHGHFPLQPEHGAVLATLVVQQRFSVVLDLSDMDDEQIAQFVTDFALTFRRLKKSSKSAVHLFYEEAHNFAPRQPESKPAFRMKRAVVKLVKEGRGSGIGCTLISQQPQDLETAARNQAGTLIAMRALGPHERKAIKGWVGEKGSSGEVDLDNALKSLETGVAYVWSPVFLRLETPLLVQISKRETFDASATPAVGEVREEPKVLQPKDMEEIRKLLTAAGANLEGMDPEILMDRISTLERELAAARTQPLPLAKPTISAAELQSLGTRVEEMTVAFGKVVDVAGPMFTQAAAALRLDVARLLAQAQGPLPTLAQALPPSTATKARRALLPDNTLGACARRLLVTMGTVPRKEWDRMELGVRAVYVYASGNFSNALSELRGQGLLLSDRLELTLDGDRMARELAANDPALTSAQVIDGWKAKLGSLARAMLDVLLAARPQALTRDQLGAQVGKESTGGYFSNALSELASPGLIEKSRPGHAGTIRPSSFL